MPYDLDDSPDIEASLGRIEDIFAELRLGELELQRIRSRFRHRRNRLAKVNSLPPEILRVVFELCVGSDLIVIDSTHPTLRISQTCAHWRAVILQPPVIWTQVDSTTLSKGGLQLLCHIFSESPVKSLRMESIPTNASSVQWALSKLPYVEELEAQVSTTSQMTPDAFFCSQSAPRLRRLSLYSLPRSFIREALQVPFFRGNTPHLRHLHLRHVCVPWRSGVCTNLVTLSITGYFYPAALVDAGTDISALLRDSPNLRTLEISMEFFENPGPEILSLPHSSSPVHLAHLKTLRLVLPIILAQIILRCITAGNLASLTLEVLAYGDRDMWARLESSLHSGAIPARLIRSLMRIRVDTHFSYCSGMAMGWSTEPTLCEEPTFNLRWRHVGSDIQQHHRFLEQLSLWILAHQPQLQYLELDGNGKDADITDTLALLMRQSTKLRLLTLNNKMANSLPAISPDNSTGDADRWRGPPAIAVHGPFSADEVEALLHRCNSITALSTLILSNAVFLSSDQAAATNTIRRILGLRQLTIVWEGAMCQWRKADGALDRLYTVKSIWPDDMPLSSVEV